MDVYRLVSALASINAGGRGTRAEGARDEEKRDQAAMRSATAWTFVQWKLIEIDALQQLLEEARVELREINERNFARALSPGQRTQSADDRRMTLWTRRRALAAATLSDSKILLDLISQAIGETFRPVKGFELKHGGSRGIGMNLAAYSRSVGIEPPPTSVVDLARVLDEELEMWRDKLVTHRKVTGEHGRKFFEIRGDLLEVNQLFPDFDEEAQFPISNRRRLRLSELDERLDRYTSEIADWLGRATEPT
jgi:hypothetical protein